MIARSRGTRWALLPAFAAAAAAAAVRGCAARQALLTAFKCSDAACPSHPLPLWCSAGSGTASSPSMLPTSSPPRQTAPPASGEHPHPLMLMRPIRMCRRSHCRCCCCSAGPCWCRLVPRRTAPPGSGELLADCGLHWLDRCQRCCGCPPGPLTLLGAALASDPGRDAQPASGAHRRSRC